LETFVDSMLELPPPQAARPIAAARTAMPRRRNLTLNVLLLL
jgi:hypothetical protein